MIGHGVRAVRVVALAIGGFMLVTSAVGVIGGIRAQDAADVATGAAKTAVRAADTARAAINTSALTVRQLKAEAAGECYRVNYFRYNVNLITYRGFLRDRTAAAFLAAKHLARLAQTFEQAARAARFLPLTDCKQATSAPRSYFPPHAIPMWHYTLNQLGGLVAAQPAPPG